jgi:hypothetical protein
VDVVNVIEDDRNSDYVWVGLRQESDGKKAKAYFGRIAVRKSQSVAEEAIIQLRKMMLFDIFDRMLNWRMVDEEQLCSFLLLEMLKKLILTCSILKELKEKNILRYFKQKQQEVFTNMCLPYMTSFSYLLYYLSIS